MFQYFFSKSGTVEPYTIFSMGHFVLLAICAFFIILFLWKNRYADEKRVLNITRICAVLLWGLEIIKIIFNLVVGNWNDPNSYIPLYFCSIPLYCSVMSGWDKGRVKRVGDVFLTVGGLVGGVGYLLSPNTTAGIYQVFHFITLQSYFLHSVMVFLGALYIVTGYCKLVMADLKYYAGTILLMCVLAYTVNGFLGSNLMFVSQNFPGTPVEVIYNLSPVAFPVSMALIQAVPPFLAVYGIVSLFERFSVFFSKDETSLHHT